MDAQAIASVGAAVTLAVEIAKWAQLPRQFAPAAVVVFSLCGVLLWGWSEGEISRAAAFGLFAGWVTVTAVSAGVYGFVRGSSESLTKWKEQ